MFRAVSTDSEPELVKKGQTRIDGIDDKIIDPIPGQGRPYVPDTSAYDIPNKNQMTIRMVLMHRAGIFDLSNQNIEENEATKGEPYVKLNYLEYVMAQDPDHQFTFDEMFGVIAQGRQAQFSPPGLKYRYSDTGYGLLALIVERVSGKAYGEFVRDELLVPNELNETTLPWRGEDDTLPAPFIPGFLWYNSTLADVTLSNMSAFVGNGNMITTPGDLSSWCRRLFSGQAGLRMDTVKTMMDGLPTSNGSTSTYGLGIHFTEKGGYGHSGAHEGYLTLMGYKPEIDTCSVMVSNVWDCQTCGQSLDSIQAQMGMMVDTVNKILDELER
ncbi:MAG: class A beta-lactamase-related serine hydrolase [Deltaproteobacteria bacterium]|nr:class A beta-lactamase-related serine hydrolase [Deltaproteobacteria bacterium]